MRRLLVLAVASVATAAVPVALSAPNFRTPHVEVRKIAGAGVRSEVRLIEAPNRLVLRALVTGNAIGSNLAYNPQRCRVGVPPGKG